MTKSIEEGDDKTTKKREKNTNTHKVRVKTRYTSQLLTFLCWSTSISVNLLFFCFWFLFCLPSIYHSVLRMRRFCCQSDFHKGNISYPWWYIQFSIRLSCHSFSFSFFCWLQLICITNNAQIPCSNSSNNSCYAKEMCWLMCMKVKMQILMNRNEAHSAPNA